MLAHSHVGIRSITVEPLEGLPKMQYKTVFSEGYISYMLQRQSISSKGGPSDAEFFHKGICVSQEGFHYS